MEDEEHIEQTEHKRECICYKSKILNKYFDDYDELVREEHEYIMKNKKELEEKEEKRKLAHLVEEAYKEYEKSIISSQERIREVTNEEREKIATARNNYTKLKNEFIDKYKSFHLTIKDKEPTVSENNDISNTLWSNLFNWSTF